MTWRIGLGVMGPMGNGDNGRFITSRADRAPVENPGVNALRHCICSPGRLLLTADAAGLGIVAAQELSELGSLGLLKG